MGAMPGADSVVVQAADYLKQKYHKPGNVFVGVVSRLDALVSGVLVLAKTSKAASRLSEQIRNQSTSKRYIAVVEGPLEDQYLRGNSGAIDLVHYLRKNESLHKVEPVRQVVSGAQEARLRLRLLRRLGAYSLVEVELVTGRKHQIRVQLSAIGHPVLGDSKYGATTNPSKSRVNASGIGLHCYRLTVQHPTLRKPMTFQVLPEHWRQVFRKVASERDWDLMFQELKADSSETDQL